MKLDRIKDWGEFSDYMINEYLGHTTEKYKVGDSDLMALTNIEVCAFNIVKYGLRILNGYGKPQEFEKIAQYAQIAWTKEREAAND